ncbi:hypothetical protein ACS0TY_011032 [Phlomoides rotata]
MSIDIVIEGDTHIVGNNDGVVPNQSGRHRGRIRNAARVLLGTLRNRKMVDVHIGHELLDSEKECIKVIYDGHLYVDRRWINKQQSKRIYYAQNLERFVPLPRRLLLGIEEDAQILKVVTLDSAFIGCVYRRDNRIHHRSTESRTGLNCFHPFHKLIVDIAKGIQARWILKVEVQFGLLLVGVKVIRCCFSKLELKRIPAGQNSNIYYYTQHASSTPSFSHREQHYEGSSNAESCALRTPFTGDVNGAFGFWDSSVYCNGRRKWVKKGVRKEDDFVIIEEDEVEGGRNLPLCLIGKVLTGKSFNAFRFLEVMKRAMCPSKGFTAKEIGPNLFSFNFKCHDDLMEVKRREPWHFEKSLVILKEIEKGEQPSVMSFTETNIWVRLYDLPMAARSTKYIQSIVSRYGEVVEIDKDSMEGFGLLCGELLENLPRNGVSCFALVAWNIWKARNTGLFEERTIPPEEITRRAMNLHTGYQAANPDPHITGKWPVITAKWSCPPPGRHKINSDATIFDDDTFGLGFVIRDDQGMVLMAGSKRCLAEGSNTLAEALAPDSVSVEL